MWPFKKRPSNEVIEKVREAFGREKNSINIRLPVYACKKHGVINEKISYKDKHFCLDCLAEFFEKKDFRAYDLDDFYAEVIFKGDK